MKWFKHDTDAFMSEGIETLIAQEGFAGYGRWFRLLEIIAFKMDETDRCWVEYPTQKWCSLLGLKQKKLTLFLELTENELKTKVVSYDNKIRIEIPNLLKKRDKYTRDLQKKGQQLTPKKKIEEVDVEVDKEKTRGKVKTPSLKLPDWLPKDAWNDFIAMRQGMKPRPTERAKELLIKKLLELKEKGFDPKTVIEQSTMNSWKSFFPVQKEQGGKKIGTTKTQGNWEDFERRKAERAEKAKQEALDERITQG